MSRVKLLFAVVLVLAVAGGGLFGSRLQGAAQDATPAPLPPTLNQAQSGGLGGGAVQPGGMPPGNPAVQLIKVADGLADPINVAAPTTAAGASS